MSARPSLWWRVRHSWSVRVLWLAWRGDPRCRATDRVEAAALLSFAMALMVAVPVAIVLGTVMTDRSLAIAHAQQNDRHPTSALVVASKTDQSNAAYPGVSAVAVVWSGPAGAVMRDTVQLSGAPRVGTHLTIWTSRDGRRADPPLTVLQAVLRTWMRVFVGLVGMVLLDLGLLAATREALMRARVRSWDAEWMEVASGRRA